MKSRLYIRGYTQGMLKFAPHRSDLLGFYYVCGRAVNLYPENDLCGDKFIVYASTFVPPDEWEYFINKLKAKYTSLELHGSRQAFIFRNEADESAFIMESSDWIDAYD